MLDFAIKSIGLQLENRKRFGKCIRWLGMRRTSVEKIVRLTVHFHLNMMHAANRYTKHSTSAANPPATAAKRRRKCTR